MEEILNHLRETYTISANDLLLPDDERNFFRGQLSMIDEVEDLHLHGVPNKHDEEGN